MPVWSMSDMYRSEGGFMSSWRLQMSWHQIGARTSATTILIPLWQKWPKSYNTTFIWVKTRICGCLVTWFCYQMIAKPGNKTATPLWPDTYQVTPCSVGSQCLEMSWGHKLTIFFIYSLTCGSVFSWVGVFSLCNLLTSTTNSFLRCES